MEHKSLIQSWQESDRFTLWQRVLFCYTLDPTLTAEEVAEKLGTTTHTVLNARGRLVKDGLLDREQRGWRDWTFTAV